MSSPWQGAEDEAVVSRQRTRVNYVVNTLSGELFRISLGEVELGSHWVPREKHFYFFSSSSCLFFFFLLRWKLSTPLHHAVSWGHLSIGGMGGLMCVELQSDPFHSICRNISESVYSLGKVLRSRHFWKPKSSPGLKLQLQLGPLIENVLISHDWVRHFSTCWWMDVFTARATNNHQCAIFDLIYY